MKTPLLFLFFVFAAGTLNAAQNNNSSPVKPDNVGLMVWHDDQTMHEYDDDLGEWWWYDTCIAGDPKDVGQSDESWTTRDMSQTWTYGYGGAANSTYTCDGVSGGVDDQCAWIENAPTHSSSIGGWQFSPTDPTPYDYGNQNYTTKTGNPTLNTVLGCEYCDVQNNYDQDYWDPNYLWLEHINHHTYTRRAHTVMALLSGGRAIPGRQILHEISGWVKHVPPPYVDGKQPPYCDTIEYQQTWYYYLPTLPNSSVHLLRDTLHDDPNYPGSGSLYYVTPAGAKPILFTPDVRGDRSYAWGWNHWGESYNDAPSFRDAAHVPVHLTEYSAWKDLNLERLNLGVGEEVNFGGMPGNTSWSASAGGIVTNQYGVIVFTAPSNAVNKATVTAKVNVDYDVKWQTDFAVFEPTSHGWAEVTQTYYPQQGQIGAGMEVLVHMAPFNVSFYRVWMWENPYPTCIPSTTEGYFASWRSSDLAVNTEAPPGFHINPDNHFFDEVNSFYANPVFPLSPGSLSYTIYDSWTIPGSGIINNLPVIPDSANLLDSSGTFSISKYSQTVTVPGKY